MFVRLKDWDERDTRTGTSFAIIERATKAFAHIKEARVFASSPPAISGLGSSARFDMELQDHAGAGHTALMAARDKLLALAGNDPGLTRVRHNGLDDSPQLQVDIDQRKAQALGVSINDINDTLQTAWGSSYVNDFMDRGRVKKSMSSPPRRSACCRMILTAGLSGITLAAWCRSLPLRLRTGRADRPAWSAITATLRLKSSGKPRRASAPVPPWTLWKNWCNSCPPALVWSGRPCLTRSASPAQAPALYALSLLVVFLCLAALYESWSVPFSVMLVVPLGVIGALLATWMRGLENDVYFQVGLLTVIGLSAKNAILIVEFANEMNAKGHELMAATLHACRQRLRPILMTSLAFVFGVLPMATSTGAGSSSQHAVGTGVMGGMISATILAIYFVPLFFVLVRRRFPLKERAE